VVAGGEVINAYTPSTGEEAWRFGGLKVNHPYGRTIAGPTGGEGVVVVVASGFQNRGFTTALRAGGKGDVTASNALWTAQKFSADCPTPVLHDGLLFSIRDDGMASCLDLKTGEPQWQERLFTDNVKVSPVLADGRVYFQSGQANCAVVKASRKFEVLARNELKESTLSTPAIANGRIYLRTDEALYCVAAR
jgi:outer membrane protein assembly factor BamB